VETPPAAATEDEVKRDKKGNGRRAFRGLVLVLLLSFVGLAGILLTIASVGGLGDWSRWQFIGLYGLIEAASGLANVIGPNFWRLPVVELKSPRREQTKLAPAPLLLPHWGGLARTLAGLLLLGAAAVESGLAAASLLLVPAIVLVAVLQLAAAAVLARCGVAWPHYDVLQVTIRYANKTREVEPISLSASVLQFLLSICTIPLVKLLSPAAFYRPELGPSWTLFAGLALAALVGVFLTLAVWSDRIDWRASRWQQREAEQNA